jgi:hypothetical protein
VLEVEGEQRVRGAVERRYRLRRELVAVDAEAVASLSVEDHRRVFAAAMATLIAEFNAYLDRTEVVAETVGYRQHAVWLSPEELGEVVAGMRAALVPMMGNEPSAGRTRYLLSPVMFPVEEGSGDAEGPAVGG